MDSDYDGSGMDDDSKSLKGDKGPSWNGQKASYAAWWYEMLVFLCLLGLGPTVKGSDRAKKDDANEPTSTAYKKKNLLLWRLLFRAISKTTTTEKAATMQPQAEFGDDHDGLAHGK